MVNFAVIYKNQLVEQAESDNLDIPTDEYLSLPEEFRDNLNSRSNTYSMALSQYTRYSLAAKYTSLEHVRAKCLSKATQILEYCMTENLTDVISNLINHLDEPNIDTDIVNSIVAKIVSWVESVMDIKPGHPGSLLRMGSTHFDLDRMSRELQSVQEDPDTLTFLSNISKDKWSMAVKDILNTNLKSIKHEQIRKQIGD